MKKLLTLVFINIVAHSASAQEAILAPLVTESILLDVAVANNTVVVGERGHVLVSNDGALKQSEVPSSVTLTSVDGIGETFLAVGHDATILRSSDGGTTWEVVLQEVNLDRPFLDVLFLNENDALAVGGYGLFYRSTDGGQTWAQEQHVSLLSPDDVEYLESIAGDEEFYQEELNFIFPHFNRLSQNAGKLYLVGEAGLIARSEDAGLSWQRFELDYFGSFFDVSTLSNGAQIAVGLRGNVFIKNDDDSWNAIESCVTTSLNSIANTPLGTFLVGNNGVVFSIDANALFSDVEASAMPDACTTHPALVRVETPFTSTISNAFVFNEVLTAVSTTGLQAIER